MSPFGILLEDEHLVAVDKPPGLPVAAAAARAPSLAGAVRERFGAAWPAHRLDDEASGAVLFARTKAALDYLSGQFQAKRAGLGFVALVEPRGPLDGDAFTIEVPLEEDPAGRGRLRPARGRRARPAETRVTVLERLGRYAWVGCATGSGRPQQVRAHLAAAGAPVVNDRLYGVSAGPLLLSGFKRGYKAAGEERPLLGRLALHASRLGFLHPAGRQPAEAQAPLPEDLAVALRQLRRFSR